MLKAQKKVNSSFIVEAEGDNIVELWEELAKLQEVFEEASCGCCSKTNLRFVVRQNADEDKFYELHCKDCYARLVFGATKKGKGLYPKRRWDALSDSEKKNRADQEDDCKNGYLPNRGWYKWVKKED